MQVWKSPLQPLSLFGTSLTQRKPNYLSLSLDFYQWDFQWDYQQLFVTSFGLIKEPGCDDECVHHNVGDCVDRDSLAI